MAAADLPARHGTERLIEPVACTWPETPATGLRKFNLGTIPASVTPPRTWRRAAWFAVGTAVFVVCALGFATYALVGNPRQATTIDALPGQPTQHLLITDLPAEAEHDSGPGPAPDPVRPTSQTSSSQAPPPRTRTVAGRPAKAGAVAVGRPSGPADPARPDGPDRVPMTAPPRSTVGLAPAPATDPEEMGNRTEQYYAQCVDNPEAAHRLTAGSMRAEGPEGIQARYADVERIEVKKITIDPDWSYTRSVLLVVLKDGSTVTVERELTFSPGADPKITRDDPA